MRETDAINLIIHPETQKERPNWRQRRRKDKKNEQQRARIIRHKLNCNY